MTDMKLCEYCQQPMSLHLGFDHDKGACLLGSSTLDLALRYGHKRAKEIIAEAIAWYAEQEAIEEASRNAGGGI